MSRAGADEEVPVPSKPDFSKAIIPGPEIPEKEFAGLVQGTGQADGVIYLDGKKDRNGYDVIKSMWREALRYLKPQSAGWLSAHPESRGRCKPDLSKILCTPQNRGIADEIRKVCEELGQPMEYTFRTRQFAIDAVQPEHLNRWHVVKTGVEGIWCVFYV